MTTIKSFYERLKKTGVEIELVSNIPWVYLYKVNGKLVEGTYLGNHGFTVFFIPIRIGQEPHITDIGVIFKKIRETLCKQK